MRATKWKDHLGIAIERISRPVRVYDVDSRNRFIRCRSKRNYVYHKMMILFQPRWYLDHNNEP